MADVDSGGGGGGRGRKGGGPKTKKKSTKIDMTAMVDVAFLLLTFFVLTATMSNSGVMELTMPPKVEEDLEDDLRQKIVEDKIMTLIVDNDDIVSYYVGAIGPDIELKETNFSNEGLRKVILGHLNYNIVLGTQRCATGKGARVTKDCWDPIFVVKPRVTARYKNLVDLLDELAITEAPKYAIDKFTETDSLLLIEELDLEAYRQEQASDD